VPQRLAGGKGLLQRPHRAGLFPGTRLSPRYQLSVNELSVRLEGWEKTWL